jgi:hypothetical protein
VSAVSTFIAFIFMLEKGSIYFAGDKQAQGADSNNKASVSCAEPILEE